MPTIAELANLAFQHHQAGNFYQAEQLYNQVLQADPNHADSHHLLGVLAYQRGRHVDAIQLIRRALNLKPDVGIFHTNLGLAQEALGQFEDAVQSHRHALILRGPEANALYNLGTALLRMQKLDEAADQLRQALALQPNHYLAHGNYGLVLAGQGKNEEAIHQYNQALRLKPDFEEAYNNLGLALHEQGNMEAALASYDRALSLRPDYADAHFNLGLALVEQGRLREAEAHWQEALRLKPISKTRLSLAALLPTIYQSADDLLAWRQRLTENVRRLHEASLTVDLTTETALHSFYPVYQGLNDKDLQCQMASFYKAPKEALPRHALGGSGVGQRIRIGFISHCFKEHTIAKLNRGLIANLARDQFEVTVLSVGRHGDATAKWIQQHADSYLEVPRPLPDARRFVAKQDLDVLFYTDIGMEPATYSLAFSRLAPVQCVTWGHPVTTGIETIDYFISSEALETDESDQHYKEQLVRLKNPAVYYYRPTAPSPLKGRNHFGLPAFGTLYLCPQSLFKFHPAFDEILAGILRQDVSGNIVILKGKHPYWEQLLRERFAVSMPDVTDRVHFIPQQDHAQFMNLNALADVLLDPIHFGGGNTSYEGLALGVPIVTLPSKFLRGRITYALYKQMNLMDCVVSTPAQYIELAVKLGTEGDYRAAISTKILAANDVLFENPAGIRELEAFLKSAVEKAAPAPQV